MAIPVTIHCRNQGPHLHRLGRPKLSFFPLTRPKHYNIITRKEELAISFFLH